MDTLNKQIHELEEKINSLYQLVERIGQQVNSLSDKKQPIASAYSLSSLEQYSHRNNSEDTDSAYSMSHKDILVDETNSSHKNPSNEKELAPEIQIRRLTAQLTAAYNRIAALEEQLLSYRIKS